MLDKLNNLLVFIEVRYRKNDFYGAAIETINYNKQRKIINTAKMYLQENSIYDKFICRFDVIGVNCSLKCVLNTCVFTFLRFYVFFFLG